MTLRLPTASRVFPGSLPQGFSCLSLLLLQGRDFPFDDCGRAFTCLPVENPRAPVEATVCNLDCLLDTMSYRVRPAALSLCHCTASFSLCSSDRMPGRAVWCTQS